MKYLFIVLMVLARGVWGEVILPDPTAFNEGHYDRGLPAFIVVEPDAPKLLDTVYLLCHQDAPCTTITDTTGWDIQWDDLGPYVVRDSDQFYLRQRIKTRCWQKVRNGLWLTWMIPTDSLNNFTNDTRAAPILLIEAPWLVPEDLNKDGEVNIRDLTGLVRHLFGEWELPTDTTQ